MSVKVKMTVLVCAMVLSVSRLALATPVIKDFSSKGGRTANKTDTKDRMYLVKPGDKITFTIKADGADKYEWMVNKKVDAEATGESFVWAVPDEKGIWEIHLTASSGKDKAHQEWVVSTLPKSEAPFFFDSFADGKCDQRTETDPWGRPLPEWRTWRKQTIGASSGSLVPVGTVNAMTKGRMTHGTWIYRHWVHKSASAGWSMGVWSGGLANNYGYRYFSGGTGTTTWQPNVELAPTHWRSTGFWATGKVIRTKDGWIYLFMDDDLVPQSIGQKDDHKATRPKISKGYPFPDGMKKDEFGVTLRGVDIDGLEFYKDKYLWPAKKIEYTDYVSSFKETRPAGTKKGIVLTGRDIRLADIAAAMQVDGKSLFTYDKKTKTAVCRADLVITGGAELVLDGETLKMLGSDLQIKPNNGATIRLNKAVIESGNSNPYWWNFTSEMGYWIYKAGQKHQAGEFLTSFAGRFVAKDSVIKDSGWIILHGATQIDLQNVKFVDMHNADKGSYKSDSRKRGLYKPYFKGEWVFQLNNRIPLQGDFNLRGLTFSCADGKKANVCLIGSDHLGKMNIYDSDFSGAVIHAKKHNRWFEWYSHPPALDSGLNYFNGTIDLINCKLGEIVVDTDRASVNPKYYLDVKVVDKSGKPVKGALVSVTNEIDDVNYPPENLQEMWDLTSYLDEGVLWDVEFWYKKFIDINNNTRPEKLAQSLMSMTDIGDIHRVITDVKKDASGRVTHFVESYKHYYDKHTVSRVYDFAYDKNGRLSGYTRTRLLSGPIGSAGSLTFQYDLDYDIEGGKVLGYTISKKTSEKSRKYADRCLRRKWYVPLRVKTDAAGHTPAPADAVHTIVLSDFVQENSGKKEFRYTITIEKNGKKKVITGVNPGPDWYRPDPNKPTRTITVVLDGKTVIEATMTGM